MRNATKTREQIEQARKVKKALLRWLDPTGSDFAARGAALEHAVAAWRNGVFASSGVDEECKTTLLKPSQALLRKANTLAEADWHQAASALGERLDVLSALEPGEA